MRINLIQIMMSLLLLTSITSVVFYQKYKAQRQDHQRLASNLSYLNQDLNYYQTRNSKLAGTNAVLIFKLSEFKTAFSDLSRDIEDLKIKLNRISSVSNTIIETHKNIKTFLRDSTINDTIKVKAFSYHDTYYNIQGYSVRDTQNVSIQSTDSLLQVVYKGKRKKPYLWFFSPRQLEQVITSTNPDSKIVYSKFIEISK